MCGITGIIRFDGNFIKLESLIGMNKTQHHRGGDDTGVVLINHNDNSFRDLSSNSLSAVNSGLEKRSGQFQKATLGLGHVRFSIIDLTSSGHQPLFDHSKKYCIVFNGELYNYIEVRNQLSAQGISFYTQSDTEVFLEAYKYWGVDCFRHLNGFWAAAIYDFNKKQLILTRDRIGKKPLFWTRVNNQVYFASEIKALLSIPEINDKKTVNKNAVYNWMVHGKKDLNNTTFYNNIHSFPAASWSVMDNDFPNKIKSFWQVPRNRLTTDQISIKDSSEFIYETIKDSVKIRLRADVPISVELSGGMDSSILAALAAIISNKTITTYTVKFDEKIYDEEGYARMIGQKYKTDYRVLKNPINNFWSNIKAFTYLEEEPYHAPNLQTNQMIWSTMRNEGIKVSINGAGGDELFAGYPRYFFHAQIENIKNGHFLPYLKNGTSYSESRNFIRNLLKPIQLLSGHCLNRIWPKRKHNNSLCNLEKRMYGSVKERILLSDILYADITNELMPYWLRSGDRGYMGIPIEVRAPFLDFRLIEFAYQLPLNYLIREGWHKWILRQTFMDILPPDVLWRKKKMGFPFPMEYFLLKNRPILDMIFQQVENPFLNLNHKKELMKNWKAISFILWYEYFINRNLDLFDRIEALSETINGKTNYPFTPAFIRGYE